MNQLILGLSLVIAAPSVAAGNGRFAIANRSESSLSIVEADGQKTQTIGFNQLGEEIEPMYLNSFSGYLAIGDRKKSQVIFFDLNSDRPVARIPTSKGIFHQNVADNALFIATDIEKGMDVIEASGSVRDPLRIRRFDLPAEFSSGKPHDVVATKDYAYLTVLDTSDALLQIVRSDLTIKNHRRFTRDTHLFNPPAARFLVLLQQANGKIHLIDKESLRDLQVIQGPVGVHGITGSPDGSLLFVTDIDQKAGEDSILVYSVFNHGFSSKHLASSPTPVAIAHNVAVGAVAGGYEVYITHSGAQSRSVSALYFDKASETLDFRRTIEVGLNPFGISFLEF